MVDVMFDLMFLQCCVCFALLFGVPLRYLAVFCVLSCVLCLLFVCLQCGRVLRVC